MQTNQALSQKEKEVGSSTFYEEVEDFNPPNACEDYFLLASLEDTGFPQPLSFLIYSPNGCPAGSSNYWHGSCNFGEPTVTTNYPEVTSDFITDRNHVVLYFLEPGTRVSTMNWYPSSGACKNSGNWTYSRTLCSGSSSLNGEHKKLIHGGQVGSGDFVFYTISNNGNLLWFRHDNYRNYGPSQHDINVGAGWDIPQYVFSPGGGFMYIVNQDGTLSFRKHLGFSDGSNSWTASRVIDNTIDWRTFKHLVAVGNGDPSSPTGYILGIKDNKTFRFKFDGQFDGSNNWGVFNQNITPTYGPFWLSVMTRVK